MTSEYYAQYLITENNDFRRRIVSSYAAESGSTTPDAWADDNKWSWAVSPGWAAKVATAIDGGNDAWALDTAVISDGDILAVIQPMANNG